MLKSYYSQVFIEAGCDEAGRGCLAGPVVASAVIFDKNYSHPILTDSKKLNKKQREDLRIEIKQEALCWAIGEASNDEIDDINILNASFLAMHRAIDQLKVKPELLLIDGNRFNAHSSISHTCIIKGDASLTVLCSSISDEYLTGMLKPAKGTILAPDFLCKLFKATFFNSIEEEGLSFLKILHQPLPFQTF